MYLHLGQDTVITTDTITGIFDLDACTVSAKTRQFLNNAEKSGSVVYASYELPKSFVVCCEDGRQVIYISQLSAKTLLNRIHSAKHEF